YLQALAKRIERAEHGPLKDTQKAQRIQPALDRLRQFTGGPIGGKNCEKSERWSAPCREEMFAYRRMVEEFRVSVFAPEIKTAMPVSEKRLKQQWQRVVDSCRRVE
ncbi:MAG: DUF3418 domain-containing protein, partial [Candidatus Electrothrix sp. AR4]|nr:DUF3418 domain-containing protein [Candidatus Electrothrix sp. AR4]